MILAIDSGGKAGFALFDPANKALVACGLNLTPKTLELPAPITRLVVERPHTGRTQARAKDIITLAIRAGEAGGLWRFISGVEPEYIEPSKWKGQLKKIITNRIVEAKLSPQEKSLLNKIKPLSAKHNVLDAVGIGLYCARRWII